MAAEAPLVVLEDVRKIHARGDRRVEALGGVTLDIRAGEYVVIEGPTGSGKTTLLDLVGLMDTPDAGRVLVDGRDFAHASERVRARERLARIGFVFQHFYLVPTLTAERNVALPLEAARVPRAERDAIVTDLFARIGLERRRAHYPHELSGGEQQLVAVARALANRPRLLLADEPTAELDPDAARRVLDLLDAASRASGAAVVHVTHDADGLPARARRVRLAAGRVVEGGGAR
ncbi:MAG: ABC transporter ATP-binding protein [Thermoplasmatota archaeon]